MRFGEFFRPKKPEIRICPKGHKSMGWWEHPVAVPGTDTDWVAKNYGPYCGVCYGEFLEKNLEKITGDILEAWK